MGNRMTVPTFPFLAFLVLGCNRQAKEGEIAAWRSGTKKQEMKGNVPPFKRQDFAQRPSAWNSCANVLQSFKR